MELVRGNEEEAFGATPPGRFGPCRCVPDVVLGKSDAASDAYVLPPLVFALAVPGGAQYQDFSGTVGKTPVEEPVQEGRPSLEQLRMADKSSHDVRTASRHGAGDHDLGEDRGDLVGDLFATERRDTWFHRKVLRFWQSWGSAQP